MRPSASILTDELTIVTPGTKDTRVGDPILDWATATRVVVRGRIAQRARSEDNAQRSAQLGEWVAYLPSSTVVDGRCRVEQGTRTFDVIGPPYAPTTGRGGGHLEITLRLAEG